MVAAIGSQHTTEAVQAASSEAAGITRGRRFVVDVTPGKDPRYPDLTFYPESILAR
jgi:hypothetical protein